MSYNLIAGKSVERLAALSDGVFAVAMTLLVLDLKPPVPSAIHSEGDLWRAVVELSPKLLMYVMSFLTMGIFWLGQQTQLSNLKESSRGLTWLHLAFLFAVSVTPFSTTFLAEFTVYRIALLAYWINILAMGALLYVTWVFAVKNELVKDEVSKEASHSIEHRIIVAQSIYGGAAALCVVSTYLSLSIMVAAQLFYAFAPRVPWQRKRDD